ncbi:hypothetical protein B0H13DRAFT_2365383 [Mycena leptocephala]|nr:hypothetical protein B0H13DRAFT_2365383 [Mycena leptocephala]
MSSNRLRAEKSSKPPSVVEDQEDWSEVEQVSPPPRRRGLRRGIPNHELLFVYRPPIHVGGKGKGKNRQSTPSRSQSPQAPTVLSSPEVEIVGSRHVTVVSSPEVTITGYRPTPAPVSSFRFHPLRGSISLSSAATQIRKNTVESIGMRIRQVPALTHDSLWQTNERPPNYEVLEDHHACSLCHGVKAHPVSYKCGCSHCYVCIRMSLEKSWQCPSCWTTINRKPYIHRAEEAGLQAAYPGWGANTSVSYSWKGLRFPKRHSVIAPGTPSL